MKTKSPLNKKQKFRRHNFRDCGVGRKIFIVEPLPSGLWIDKFNWVINGTTIGEIKKWIKKNDI